MIMDWLFITSVLIVVFLIGMAMGYALWGLEEKRPRR
jgi:hypothetical protein